MILLIALLASSPAFALVDLGVGLTRVYPPMPTKKVRCEALLIQDALKRANAEGVPRAELSDGARVVWADAIAETGRSSYGEYLNFVQQSKEFRRKGDLVLATELERKAEALREAHFAAWVPMKLVKHADFVVMDDNGVFRGVEFSSYESFNAFVRVGGRKLFTEYGFDMLNLRGAKLQDAHVQPLAGWHGLKRLDVSHNDLTSVGIGVIARIKTLQRLNISFQTEGDHVGAGVISVENAMALAANQNLTHLNLGYSSLNTEGAIALARSKSITHLTVNACNICSVGAMAFASMTTLRSLNISSNHIGDVGVEALAGAGSLRELDLSYVPFTDLGASALAKSSSLKRLAVVTPEFEIDGQVPEHLHEVLQNPNLTHLSGFPYGMMRERYQIFHTGDLTPVFTFEREE